MSEHLPVVTARNLVRALQRVQFRIVRQSGSHAILEHANGRFAVIPMHGGDIPKGTLMTILKSAGLTVEDIRELL